ncbi:hypothetical protein [Rhodococcus sp. HS-D2]|uniref:hypothetical protein n=1 Tax=Rhodococcus sp. HS-D2 TaxID=1384636 RepID=UPI000AC804EC|nr:hypothetical protein [Rhodococcus sp. HS-D2]
MAVERMTIDALDVEAIVEARRQGWTKCGPVIVDDRGVLRMTFVRGDLDWEGVGVVLEEYLNPPSSAARSPLSSPVLNLLAPGPATESIGKLAEAFDRKGEISPEDAKQRSDYLANVVKLSGLLVKQAEKWPIVAWLGVGAVLVLSAASAGLIWLLLGKLNSNNFNGSHLALIIFALALFVSAPGVLLILGRPLAGIDSWNPGGILASDKPAEKKDEKEPEKKEGQQTEDPPEEPPTS